MERAQQPLVRRALDHERAVFLLHSDAFRHRLGQHALRAVHSDQAVSNVDVDTSRNRDRHSSYARHGMSLNLRNGYQTYARTSPPTFSRRARSPVITPRGVDITATPTPP